MAKIRGVQKYDHKRDIHCEANYCETLLDSLHQHFLVKHPEHSEQMGRALGSVRSIQARLGFKQKTLKRWMHPAPNQNFNHLTLWGHKWCPREHVSGEAQWGNCGLCGDKWCRERREAVMQDEVRSKELQE